MRNSLISTVVGLIRRYQNGAVANHPAPSLARSTLRLKTAEATGRDRSLGSTDPANGTIQG